MYAEWAVQLPSCSIAVQGAHPLHDNMLTSYLAEPELLLSNQGPEGLLGLALLLLSSCQGKHHAWICSRWIVLARAAGTEAQIPMPDNGALLAFPGLAAVPLRPCASQRWSRCSSCFCTRP